MHTVQPAFEDGTDTGFRNVGQLQFDAGEIPRRKYTTNKWLFPVLDTLNICERVPCFIVWPSVLVPDLV